ncbi:NADH:flavin oxidoreductase/NADH oxidase family protein [Haliangium sp.]|uniref:NADH:flavin oxidoreductase/NADH oxidase family protein n=1 Tax=Haliangium sp. TaxID=2663208 RepID=UPI003D0ADE5B
MNDDRNDDRAASPAAPSAAPSPSAPAALAEPLRLSTARDLPNRIAKSAMSERMADRDGAPSADLIALYRRWARGGAGLLITGNVMIDHEAISEHGNVVVEDRRHLDALRAWAEAAQSGGGRIWAQINHPGRQVPRTVNRRPVAPSPIAVRGTGGMFARPRALTGDEVEAIIARFATTAAVLEEAGFDGVQIHAAHGYLISQFLSPLTNQREDDWGGTPAKRRRFLLEVVRAVRAAVSERFAVAVKLNSADFQRGGFDQAESMRVVEALEEAGIDLLEISGGTYESTAMFEETVPQHDSSRRREAYFIDYAEQVRARTRVPLMVTGGFRTAAGMVDALAGATDVIGMARPLAIEPDLPARLLAGEADAARPISLSTGIKKVDGMLQPMWYQVQLDRMGRGLEPAPRLSRWYAVLRYLLPPPRRERATRALQSADPAALRPAA